jgi:hypothetical protein
MERHFLVTKSFVGLLGFICHKGDIGVPGDSASPEVWEEIQKQVKAGNLKPIGEGERGRDHRINELDWDMWRATLHNGGIVRNKANNA